MFFFPFLVFFLWLAVKPINFPAPPGPSIAIFIFFDISLLCQQYHAFKCVFGGFHSVSGYLQTSEYEPWNLLIIFDIYFSFLADDRDLTRAHSVEYIDALEVSDKDVFDDKFGLSYDCPPQNKLYERCQLIAGSTLSAARSLTSGQYKVAINWHGGWHHARRDHAAGFCYVNDINIAIKHLLLYSKR